ncbi:MAG: hypothetical protein GEU99_03180 [Luteitalea sp.]|nr:hypothetical protein [Luteitalea sp.]
MESRGLLRRLVPVVLCVTAAVCDGSLAPSVEAQPGKTAIVRGTERIGWDQQTGSASEPAALHYVAYVDGVKRELTDVRCADAAGPSGYACDAPLPQLTPGTHVLELATLRLGRRRMAESARSAPLHVTLVSSTGAASSNAQAPVPSRSDTPSDVEPAEPREADASTEANVAITLPDGTRLVAETVVTNLDRPTAIAVGSDGRLFVGERSGRVLAFDDGRPLNATVLEDVAATGDAGLLGIALHPDFAQNRFVYVVHTTESAGRTLGYRLSRFREVNGVLGERAILLDEVPAAPAGANAVMRFGPDRKLYVAFGRAGLERTSSPAAYSGSLLRLNDEGTTPDDNPQPSPVYSFGHDTPHGFDWNPTTHDLWEVERVDAGRDELNRIEPGGNYGDEGPAPSGVEGPAPSRRRWGRAGAMAPVVAWPAALGSSGAAIYDGTRIASLHGDLLIAGLESQDLMRVQFDRRDPTRVASTERLLQGRFGRIANVEVGPEEAIYFLTGNRGHEVAAIDDDRLVRLLPEGAATTQPEP